MSQLSKDECRALHVVNAGRLCFLEYLAVNDLRFVLRNEAYVLHVFANAEHDETEQAQAARLCAAINEARGQFVPTQP